MLFSLPLYWKTSETSYNAICFPLFPIISTLQKWNNIDERVNNPDL